MCKPKILLKNIFSEESKVKDLTEERYDQDYEALTFSFKGEAYQGRLVKKTPTKSEYFVTCWTEDGDNYNRPYRIEEFADYLIVAVIGNELDGYLLFPRELLVEKGTLASSKYQGKVAFRVHPKWCNQLNKTARQTRKWQCKYFSEY